MIYPKGKLRLEESTMTITLTLNEITLEQVENVLDLLRGGHTATPTEAAKPAETTNATEEYEDVTPATDEDKTKHL